MQYVYLLCLIILKFSRDRNLAGEIAQEFQKRQVTTLIHVIVETGILSLPLIYLLLHGTSALLCWWLLLVIIIILCLLFRSHDFLPYLRH